MNFDKMKSILFITITIICSITQVALCNNSQPSDVVKQRSIPVFPTNYHVDGVVSLPYAELEEPFSAWYDKDSARSRTDYFGNTYKVYQFGPHSTQQQGAANQFGALYKLVYVPADFNQKKDEPSLLTRLHKVWHANRSNVNNSDAATKRACFSVLGSVGNTISPQTVLPDLTNFKFEMETKCPFSNEQFRDAHCELWKMDTKVGEKENKYKMWITRKNDGTVVPVYYYMLGYDTLLGSHYDRYDVTYRNFKSNSASDEDFDFDASSQSCGPMPGPGDGSSDAETRSHIIVQNPIHEIVVDPHRYDHIDHEFEKFKETHQKKYRNDVHHRKSWSNFLHNFRFINSKNRQLKQYKLKVNKFADTNHNELNYLRGRIHSKGYNGGLDYGAHHKLRHSDGSLVEKLPEDWDWNIRGAVTPVKDQAICGSCWSFGTTGTLEGAYFVKTGKLLKLSQQQMIDCSWQYGNNGCDGGEDFRAYKYIMSAGGIATQEDYGAYMGIDGKCHDRMVKKSVKISGFYNVTKNDVEALKHALKTYGPVTVAIDASRPTFTFYSHGAYYDDKCKNGDDNLDHQVLVVGYTKIDGKFVWIVKNSWSTYWGDNGYIMMSAENNNCGVMDMPTVPIIAE